MLRLRPIHVFRHAGKEHTKAVHVLVKARHKNIHKKHTELKKTIEAIPHLFATEVYRLKHKAKEWARAAVSKGSLSLALAFAFTSEFHSPSHPPFHVPPPVPLLPSPPLPSPLRSTRLSSS